MKKKALVLAMALVLSIGMFAIPASAAEATDLSTEIAALEEEVAQQQIIVDELAAEIGNLLRANRWRVNEEILSKRVELAAATVKLGALSRDLAILIAKAEKDSIDIPSRPDLDEDAAEIATLLDRMNQIHYRLAELYASGNYQANAKEISALQLELADIYTQLAGYTDYSYSYDFPQPEINIPNTHYPTPGFTTPKYDSTPVYSYSY